MKRWGYFLGAVAISPLVLPLMVGGMGLYAGVYAVERSLASRRLEQKALEALEAFKALKSRYRAAMVYRPTSWERLMGDPVV